MRVAMAACGAVMLVGALAACGGGSGGGGGATTPTAPNNPTTTPVETTTITITSGGVTPKDIVVAVGSRVSFVNQSGAAREPSSNAHPTHLLCPDLNLGQLSNGQTAQTAALNTARVCGFHDHLDPDRASLQGTVTIR